MSPGRWLAMSAVREPLVDGAIRLERRKVAAADVRAGSAAPATTPRCRSRRSSRSAHARSAGSERSDAARASHRAPRGRARRAPNSRPAIPPRGCSRADALPQAPMPVPPVVGRSSSRPRTLSTVKGSRLDAMTSRRCDGIRSLQSVQRRTGSSARHHRAKGGGLLPDCTRQGARGRSAAGQQNPLAVQTTAVLLLLHGVIPCD